MTNGNGNGNGNGKRKKTNVDVDGVDRAINILQQGDFPERETSFSQRIGRAGTSLADIGGRTQRVLSSSKRNLDEFSSRASRGARKFVGQTSEGLGRVGEAVTKDRRFERSQGFRKRDRFIRKQLQSANLGKPVGRPAVINVRRQGDPRNLQKAGQIQSRELTGGNRRFFGGRVETTTDFQPVSNQPLRRLESRDPISQDIGLGIQNIMDRVEQSTREKLRRRFI